MKCPECDTLYGDEIRGRLHCKECNTHLIIRVDKTTEKVTVSIEPTNVQTIEREPSKPPHRVIKFVPDGGKVDYSIKCYFCAKVLNAAERVEGTRTVGFDKQEVELDGEVVEKYIPRIKKVNVCIDHMDNLKGMRKTGETDENTGLPVYEEFSTVKPTLNVNPIEERFKYGRNEIRRIVKDVTYDINRADDFDTTPCTTYVDCNGKCLYCGGKEINHTIHVLGRTVRLERYNSR